MAGPLKRTTLKSSPEDAAFYKRFHDPTLFSLRKGTPRDEILRELGGKGVPEKTAERIVLDSDCNRETFACFADLASDHEPLVVKTREAAKKKQGDLMAEFTPNEFTSLGLGYMSMEQAPEELLDTYDFDRRMMKRNATWDGLPVTLLKGGINGQVHFRGVGLVRYGAEKEAQIAQILASGPDGLRG